MLLFFIDKKFCLFVISTVLRYIAWISFFVYRIAATIPTGTSKMMEQDVLSDESSTVATPLYVPTGVTRYMEYHLPVD